jgi:hypothetical protein
MAGRRVGLPVGEQSYMMSIAALLASDDRTRTHRALGENFTLQIGRAGGVPM